jgi:hypothetical protein
VRQPEVRDDDTRRPRRAGVEQHHVIGFEIAVNDPGRVRGRERTSHLFNDCTGLIDTERAQPAKPLRERLSLQQLHRHERHRACGAFARPVLEEIEDAADVRVRHLSRQLDLAPETLGGPFMDRDLGADRLERDAFPERQVLGLVQFAHAPARDESDDAEPFAQQISGAKRRGDMGRARRVGVRAGRTALPGGIHLRELYNSKSKIRCAWHVGLW